MELDQEQIPMIDLRNVPIQSVFAGGWLQGCCVTSVPGFRQGVVLHSATDCVVYRAVREADDLPVVLKILASEIPTPRELMRYRQEFKILRSIPVSDYVLQGYDLLETGEAVAIVLEDFGGIALNRCDFVERLAIDEVLSLAIAVATGLGQIHAASVIHKDINPGNLLYRRESGLVKIGDFGLASLLSRENPVIGHLEGLEGTPSYISPEQTGRMNRSLDYRTDLYSFGATLYELLAGRPPFAALSMMELVHCHIAKLAPPPHEVDSRVPRVLSEITMKLLAKTPEARYQSAFGVKADLERCLEHRRRGGPIISFPIAEKDVSDRLNIPQKLYGRKRELDALLAGFEEVVCQGGLRAVMISGSPGIGKTSLVQEIYKPMTQHQGTYICGRFDPLRRDTPYFALGAACQQLVDHVLGQEEEQIKRWRDEILAAVAACGQVHPGGGQGGGQSADRPGRGAPFRPRSRDRHRAGVPGEDLRELLPGRGRIHPPGWRHRAGAGHHQEADRAARWSDLGGERARQGQLLLRRDPLADADPLTKFETRPWGLRYHGRAGTWIG